MSKADGATAEEIAADCPFLNEYCQERHNGVVRCAWSADKGRILLACRRFRAGQIIFREPPLHIVAEQPGHDAFDRLRHLCEQDRATYKYEPLWYWTTLCSLTASQLVAGAAQALPPVTEDQQRKLLLLYHPEVKETSKAIIGLAREFGLDSAMDPLQLERLLQVWVHNCFEHSEDPLGFSTYLMSSLMSHSCLPNAVWHYDSDDFILRARRSIEEGEEVTVSYLSEEALLESVPSRRKQLKDSKHFVCNCARCTGPRDLCRGFRCPDCKGHAFSRPEMDEQAVGGQAAFRGAACELCHRDISTDEAASLLQIESWLETQTTWYERAMEKNSRSRHSEYLLPLEEVALRAEIFMSQHWLLDKAWGLLVDVYERNGRPVDSEAYLRRRIEFQERAYPELSGTRAWTLEAYADLLLRHARVSVDPQVHVPDERAAREVSITVVPVYAQSLDTLVLMFGDQHEYYLAVHRKAVELSNELKRLLGDSVT